MKIAAAAAPYTSPGRNASEVSVKHSLETRSDAEIAADIEALRTKISRCRERWRDAAIACDG
jgi:hypothetical protein